MATTPKPKPLTVGKKTNFHARKLSGSGVIAALRQGKNGPWVDIVYRIGKGKLATEKTITVRPSECH